MYITMKKYLLICGLLLASFVGFSQIGYGYTYIAQRYNWLAGVFNNGFGVPAGDGAVFFSGQYQRAGALYYDSTGVDSGLYVWSGLAWRNVSDGGGSPFTLYANLPLYVDGDTVYIDPATSISDGYATAAQIAKLDTLANNWVRVNSTRLYTANTTDSIIVGVPTTTLHAWNLIGNGHIGGDIFGPANRRIFKVTGQNLYAGSRSGNTASSGDAENTAVGELALGSITDGDNNFAGGKSAGFTITSGSNWIVIGRNVHASGGAGTGLNNIAIGANVPDPAASQQLNLNNWLYGDNGRLGIGSLAASHTPTAAFDIDSTVDYPHLRLREMAANPTVINDGNFWHYNDHFYARLNGATVQLDNGTAIGGIDDVLALAQAMTANRTINTSSFNLNIGGSGQALLVSSSAGVPLSVLAQPASTNTTETVAAFRRATTGTAAANIAGSLDFNIQNASGSNITGSQLIWRLTTATAGAEVSNVVIKGLNAGAATDLLTMQPGYTLNNNGADTLETRSGARSRAETVTNKRNVRRTTTITSSATPTPDGDASDIFTVTALAAGAIFAAPTGTPIAGQGLIIRIKDNGGAQTLGFNAIYRAGDIALPTTTVAGKYLWLGFIWNDQSTTWDLVSKVDNF